MVFIYFTRNESRSKQKQKKRQGRGKEQFWGGLGIKMFLMIALIVLYIPIGVIFEMLKKY